MNPQPSTSTHIITIVVVSISLLAMIGLCALSYCLIMETQVDQVLLTAFFGLEGSLIGYLGGILTSTKSSHATESQPVVANDPKNL